MQKKLTRLSMIAILIVFLVWWIGGQTNPYDCRSRASIADTIQGLTTDGTQLSVCIKRTTDTPDTAIKSSNCKDTTYITYIARDESGTTLLSTAEEFRAYFAPVDNSYEALGFVTALTDAYPLYRIDVDPDRRTYVSYIEPTTIKKTDDGRRLGLFSYTTCGCGPHPYYRVDYAVSVSGEVTELRKRKLYEDPALDDWCNE